LTVTTKKVVNVTTKKGRQKIEEGKRLPFGGGLSFKPIPNCNPHLNQNLSCQGI